MVKFTFSLKNEFKYKWNHLKQQRSNLNHWSFRVFHQFWPVWERYNDEITRFTFSLKNCIWWYLYHLFGIKHQSLNNYHYINNGPKTSVMLYVDFNISTLYHPPLATTTRSPMTGKLHHLPVHRFPVLARQSDPESMASCPWTQCIAKAFWSSN